jgi:anti-anti-sigma factor
MFFSQLVYWYCGRAGREVAADSPQVVPPALPAPRRPAAVPTVKVVISQAADSLVIRVKGDATADSAGALLAELLGATACRPAVVTLDLSELRSLSSLAMGVLVSYRRGVVRKGSRVRLAGDLHRAVEEALVRAELLELFEITADAGSVPGRPARPVAVIQAV